HRPRHRRSGSDDYGRRVLICADGNHRICARPMGSSRPSAERRRSEIVMAKPAIFVILFGVVLIYLPIRLFGVLHWPTTIGGLQVTGIVVGGIGVAVALAAAVAFAFIGRGTPAPFAAPQRLVTRGLHRLVRNPMYIGVGLFFAGAAIFYQSVLVFAYVVLFV